MTLTPLTPTRTDVLSGLRRLVRHRAAGGDAFSAAVNAFAIAVAREAFVDGAVFAGGNLFVAVNHFDAVLAGLRATRPADLRDPFVGTGVPS